MRIQGIGLLAAICSLFPSAEAADLPDLAPLALQVAQDLMGPPNPEVALSWGVTNQGVGSVEGSWFHHLSVSTNAFLDDTARYVADWYGLGTFPVEGEAWGTNRVRLPLTESGVYYLIFRVDPQDWLIELDENNNTLVVPFTFQCTPPDLMPVAIQGPTELTGPPNPRVTFVLGVTNQGSGPAEPEWHNAVYVSTNAVFDAAAVYVGDWYSSGPLAAGRSAWTSNTFGLPLRESGLYYVLLRTDVRNDLVELDESNNVMAVPFLFHSTPPDLVPIEFRTPSTLTAPPNPEVTLSWTVTNQGPGPAVTRSWHWQDALYVSTSAPNAPLQHLASISESGPLAAGGSYHRTRSVRLPVTESGTYYLWFQANIEGAAGELNHTNNRVGIPFNYRVTRPDLVATLFEAPDVVTGPPKPTVTLSWAVQNQGTDPAASQYGWEDWIYVSTNAIFDSDAIRAHTEHERGPLPAGASYQRSRTVLLPLADSGGYHLFFRAGSSGSLGESDMSNNLRTASFTFHSTPPDLAPASLQIPASVVGTTYTPMNVVYCVTNQGTGPAIGASYWQDRLYLSTRATLDDTAYSLSAPYESGPISAASSYQRTNLVWLPSLTNGSYFILLETDSQASLTESDETNNVLAMPFTFHLVTNALPDLAPVTFQAPIEVRGAPYPTVTVVWGVTNQGIGPSGNLHPWNAVYVSTNAAFDDYARRVVDWPLSEPLAPGGAAWGTNRFRLPLTEGGTYYLFFVTDYYRSVAESDENNNVVAVPFTYQIALADLAPLGFQVPVTITGPPNPSVTLVWGVTNQGLGVAEGHASPGWSGFLWWEDRVYISTDPVLENGWAEYVGSVLETDPLPAAASYWRTNTLRLPIQQSGTYYLHLRVDASLSLGGSVMESVESNNGLVVPFTFQATPPNLAPVVFHAPPEIVSPAHPLVTFVWGVTNQGVGAVESDRGWSDAVFLSATGVLDGTEEAVFGVTETNAVPAGGSYGRTNRVSLPLNYSGSYYLIFVTDSGRAIAESDEQDNVRVVPFTYDPTPPDLAPVAFRVPTVVTGAPHPRVTLAWEVVNQGVGAAEATNRWQNGWDDRVYLSASPRLDGTEQYVGGWRETTPVSPGSSYRRTNTVRVPVTDSGTYYLIFEANASQALDEWDRFNNTLAVPVVFDLSAPPPPGTLKGAFLPDGTFVVEVYGEPGRHIHTQYTLEASTDLQHWERVADFLCVEYPTSVPDPAATPEEPRFYRVVLLTQPAELRLDLVPDASSGTRDPELILEGPLSTYPYYSIQASDDLLDWETLSYFQLVRSPLRFRDPSATNVPVRFYRAVQQ